MIFVPPAVRLHVFEILRDGALRLSPRDDAHLVSDLLLCHVFECSRESLILRHRDDVSERDAQRFFSFIEKVRSGIPVAYILKRKEFFGLDFYVDERVLIPRPETEILVEEVLKIYRTQINPIIDSPHTNSLSRTPDFIIADIGTGSGCIAVSLAKYLRNSRFFATDISPDALEVARKNVEYYNLSNRIILIQGDLLGAVSNERFDLIVANLPYVGEQKNRFISLNVERTEPHIALFGGSDGLRLYERLFEQILTLPYRPRFILGEFGFAQGKRLRGLLRHFFGKNFRILSDCAGIERVFVVSLT